MIQLTSVAAREVQRLLRAKNRQGDGIRVEAQGGGCSGLSYTIQIENKAGEHDRVFEIEGITVFCDPKSFVYLNGMTLDYSNQMIGGGFQFVQPGAVGASAGNGTMNA